MVAPGCHPTGKKHPKAKPVMHPCFCEHDGGGKGRFAQVPSFPSLMNRYF